MNAPLRSVHAALVAGLMMASAGCSVLPERPLPPAVHDFGPPTATARAVPHAWSGVSVEAPDWLRDPKLRYRLLYRQPTRVQYYALDRWVAPPPDLLAQSLSAAAGPAGCTLRIDLQTFEQLFPQPGQARVVVEFAARVTTPGIGSEPPLAERRFTLDHPCPTADAAGAVAAYSSVIDEAIGKLDQWLGSLPRASLSSCSGDPVPPATIPR